MTDQPLLTKYNDLGNPAITIYIDDQPITNTLIDLGATINIMTMDLFTTLGLHELRHTPTVLELADRSHVRPKEVLEDVVIIVASWRYPTDFLILQTKIQHGGTSFDFRETFPGHCRSIYRVQIWIYDDFKWLGYKEP